MPALTVAIPTYNRSQTLDLLLQSISRQSFTDVEVIVLDNASEDGTKAVVSKYIDRIYGLRYVRHESNIGSDRNFIECFRAASSDHVWIVGDDELLFVDSIDRIKQLIHGHDFGCAYLSSRATFLEQLPSHLNSIAGIRSPIIFKQWDFAKFINYRLTFLSGTVVNKRAILEKYDNFDDLIEPFLDSNLVHLSWVCSAILSKPFSIYVDTPLFASTVANSGGYNPVKVFITNLGDIFASFFSGVAKNPRRTVNLLTLLGWFPKVSYDMRFTSKYLTGPKFAISDFPVGMRTGIEWFLYQSIMKSTKPIAFLAVVFMKASYKIFLSYMRLTKGVKHAF